MRRLLATLAMVAIAVPVAGAATRTFEVQADRDNTLIEESQGLLSNGSGPVLFIGRTAQAKGSIRRGLLRFDLVGAVPPAGIVEAVRLRIHVAESAKAAGDVRVHAVAADWGEGASFATGGKGAPAQLGDATWLHTFFATEAWLVAGGYFVANPSASRAIGSSGDYTFEGSESIRDVQRQLADPAQNFGWILIGDESVASSAIRVDTRESLSPDRRPRLEIDVRLPPTGGGHPRP